jgi:hypothetical protein
MEVVKLLQSLCEKQEALLKGKQMSSFSREENWPLLGVGKEGKALSFGAVKVRDNSHAVRICVCSGSAAPCGLRA